MSDYEDSWAKAEIDYVVEKGLMRGYPNGDFRPDDFVSRAEFARVTALQEGYLDPVVTPPFSSPGIEPPLGLSVVPGWNGNPIWGVVDRGPLIKGPTTVLTVKTDTVFRDMHFLAPVRVMGAVVKFTNCLFATTSWIGIQVVSGGKAIVEVCEFDGRNGSMQFGITGTALVYRSYFHDLEDAVKLGANSTYEQNYIEELGYAAVSHEDGFQSSSKMSGTLIANNHIRSTLSGNDGTIGGTTSCIIIKSDSGLQRNVDIIGNVMYGGSYSLYIRDGGFGIPEGIRVVANTFLGGQYGIVSGRPNAAEWMGNVDADGKTV